VETAGGEAAERSGWKLRRIVEHRFEALSRDPVERNEDRASPRRRRRRGGPGRRGRRASEERRERKESESAKERTAREVDHELPES
jgi:hypothetical protein